MRYDAVLCALPLQDWKWNQHQLPICSWIDQYKKLCYVLKKCHKLVQRVCAAFASLGNVTAKAAFRLLRLLFVCTFSKHYVIYRPVKNLVRLLFTWTVFTDFWLKLLLLFPRAAVGVIQWLWFKERGVSCPQSELLFFWERMHSLCLFWHQHPTYLCLMYI